MIAQQGVEEGLDIRTERRANQASVDMEAQAVSLRSFGIGLTESNFTPNTRANRLTTTGVENDLWFETDTGWLYRATGTAWAYVTGIDVATDVTRTNLTISSADNGALFYVTDTGKLWRVEGGAWSDKFTTITLTTALKIGSNQVVNARKTGWGSPSGTLSRAAYAAYAGQTVSNPPTQAEMQTLDDAVKLLSQTFAAWLTDALGHGLIGA